MNSKGQKSHSTAGRVHRHTIPVGAEHQVQLQQSMDVFYTLLGSPQVPMANDSIREIIRNRRKDR